MGVKSDGDMQRAEWMCSCNALMCEEQKVSDQDLKNKIVH